MKKDDTKDIENYVDGLNKKTIYNEKRVVDIEEADDDNFIDNQTSSIEDDLSDNELVVHEQTDFSKVVDLLLNDKYKRRKTILGTHQVAPLTTLDVMAQLYDIPFLRIWISNFAEWRTSGDGGKGRKDIVDISKFHYASQQKDNDLLQNLRNR